MLILAYVAERHGGRVDWSLGILRCVRRFKSQWQWVRSAIITETVFRSFLITPRWFSRGTPVSSTYKKKLQKSNSKLVASCRGRLSTHLLSLHNRAGVAGSRSALTSHRLKYQAPVKIWHLFIFLFIYLSSLTKYLNINKVKMNAALPARAATFGRLVFTLLRSRLI